VLWGHIWETQFCKVITFRKFWCFRNFNFYAYGLISESISCLKPTLIRKICTSWGKNADFTLERRNQDSKSAQIFRRKGTALGFSVMTLQHWVFLVRPSCMEVSNTVWSEVRYSYVNEYFTCWLWKIAMILGLKFESCKCVGFSPTILPTFFHGVGRSFVAISLESFSGREASLLHFTNQRCWFHASHESAHSAGISCRLSPYEALYISLRRESNNKSLSPVKAGL